MVSERGVAVIIRPADRPGDLGWVLMAHAEVYREQLGWDERFDALVARVVADYAAGHDAEREAGWIAEAGGDRVGCIFLVAADEPGVAKLRLLLVHPDARGLGVGTRLVSTCVAFARASAYRAVALWTTDALEGARAIYRRAGFELRTTRRSAEFGHEITNEDWWLDLAAPSESGRLVPGRTLLR